MQNEMGPVAVHIAAPNDINGNPQRGWIITGWDDAAKMPTELAFVDEGYRGWASLDDAGFEHIARTGYTIQVGQPEYRRWVRGLYCEVKGRGR